MSVLIKIKGGPNSGWHAPPKGTHSAAKHVAVGSGKSGGGKVVPANVVSDMLTAGSIHTDSHSDRGKVKNEIAESLQGDGISYDDANAVLASWAQTSVGSTGKSLSIQKDAADEFGIPVGEFVTGKLEALEQRKVKWSAEWRDAGRTEEQISDRLAGHSRFKPVMEPSRQRKLLRNMHDNTQQAFADAGYKPTDKVTLYRGVEYRADKLGAGVLEDMRSAQSVNISGNPLESWSTSPRIAEMFADPSMPFPSVGIVLKMDVPIGNIVSTARTGLGCLHEMEMVVMGSTITSAEVSSFRDVKSAW